MLGEDFIIEKEHKDMARELFRMLIQEITVCEKKYVVSIAGESGSGKTGIALEFTNFLNKENIKAVCVQQDDYFFLPPNTNYRTRKKDISLVGTSEVNLKLLDQHIREFKVPDTKIIIKPLVFFKENRIEEEEMKVQGAKVMVVEGTYVSLLKNVDKKVFLTKTYLETFEARKRRNRDEINEFDKNVLEIEHKIIKTHKDMNDIILGEVRN